ncbi:putative piwi-domain-containing protein [Phytophthora infestans]|uniref:Putative piwi-domain-containing protein n=1 Tax=Phytophthora infestans TaxID=4787 RepID=A0A833W5V0_PHYIN|nr:putative piwi-domain-containing protein [Phytophthora infestans]
MVRDDEMSSVLEMGMRAVAVAFKMISDGYKPLVTFIVVKKTPSSASFSGQSTRRDSKGNVKPGTVMAAMVMDPHQRGLYF